MPLPPLLLGSLIGGGAGLLSYPFKKAQADKERQYNAEMSRWSPWTGFQAKYVQNPSLMGDVLTGAGSGLAFSAMNQGLFATPETESVAGELTRGRSPYLGMLRY